MAGKSKRMGTVLWLAAQSERAAAERLLASRREIDDLSHKLAQLQAGRSEYLSRLASGTTMGVAQMRELRNFVGKLDIAISQLRQQLAHKQDLNDQHREQWQGQKRRQDALGDIADRYRREEARAAENKVQREIDDRRPLPDGGER
ncbi:MAG: hypothetical protein HONDAALG_01604 [Gammaproteobacteria bacterium]|nr:hypothetical protein [Gammaproteobacteria bacterium]